MKPENFNDDDLHALNDALLIGRRATRTAVTVL
jgi:hypothetical protein